MKTPTAANLVPRPSRRRWRFLWAAVTAAAAMSIVVGAAGEIVALQHRAARSLQAQVALANVAHQVDGVRFWAGPSRLWWISSTPWWPSR